MEADGGYEKYLSSPLIVGKSKYNTYKKIKEGIWNKVQSWKNNLVKNKKRGLNQDYTIGNTNIHNECIQNVKEIVQG